MFENFDLQQALFFLGYSLIAALVLALLLFLLAVRQIRKINIPPGAGFAETLYHTPFLVVLIVDLLDFGLDIFAAPFTWILLDRWGLAALRGVSTVEALLPFTQAIPTMTLSWVYVRIAGY